MANEPISFQELKQAVLPDPAPSNTLQADDDITLSYRYYVPSAPKAVVVWYHEMGFHSEAGYQFIGDGLKSQFDIAVYIPDIRGHGASGGPRGDTPNPFQLVADVSVMIKQIRKEHPDLPIFLGGHSAGAGMILNYSFWPEREKHVNGYIFLAPQWGPLSNTARPGQNTSFVKIEDSAFIAYMISNGKLRGNHYAVKIKYPRELLNELPDLVDAITVNMAVAITPVALKDQFKTLDRPFGMWIGSDDELFVPEKVLSFAKLAKSAGAGSQAGVIQGEKHASILINAHKTIGPWIESLL